VGYAIAAIRDPRGVAIIDELGQVTFADVHRRTNALANAFRARGIGRATASRSSAATTAASSTPSSRARSSAPTACC
jgi:acyl-CoA synthetase (AMP-forming)/AMP-acid ligase II